MILRKLNSLTTLANNTARVSRVTAVNMSRCHEYNICRAAGLVRVVLTRYVIRILASNTLKFLTTIGREQHFVYADERVDKGLLVVLASEILVTL